jgi:hypothetical protein
MNDQEPKKKEELEKALRDVDANKHQDLSKENLGNEPEETGKGDPDSPYKLKNTLDDKRPEDNTIKKGWTVDFNTSRDPQDQ